MPTLSPGCTRVPRWRTRICPALTRSPPYTLTPRRLDCESRPLRELPPAFLCAMCRFYLLPLDDVVDADLGVRLPMSLRFLVVLAPAQLEDLHLVAPAVRKHGGLHLCAGNEWRADLDAVAGANEQYVLKRYGFANRGGQ